MKIKETQKLSDSLEKMNVEKLTNTKNQEEYSNLYKTLLRQKQFNEKNKQAVARIEYAAQNNDYETVVDELNKLQSQIGVSDSKGIIFKPDSTLSKAIIDSTEFQRFVQNNVTKMLSGQVVNGSINFDVTKSTHYALGHTDIIDAYIDAEGNLRAKVIDTYDFNKNDPDLKVEWAWNVQEHCLLTNFFTINIIVIPAQEWIKLLNII